MGELKKGKIRVLFLCTHNQARSQMGEAILKKLGGDRYEVYSAGSEPTKEIHPMAVKEMGYQGYSMEGQFPKHLNLFLDQKFDYIISTCARLEAICPTFPGDPEQIHWFFPDPADFVGGYFAQQAEFGKIAQQLENRIRIFIALPYELTPANE